MSRDDRDYDWRDDDDEYYREARSIDRLRPRHSGLGIASFIIGLIVLILDLILIAMAIVIGATARPIGRRGEESLIVVVGVMACGGGVAAIVGFCLGIAGVCQTNRSKVFAILGLVFNGLIVLGVVFLWLVGMAQQRRF